MTQDYEIVNDIGFSIVSEEARKIYWQKSLELNMKCFDQYTEELHEVINDLRENSNASEKTISKIVLLQWTLGDLKGCLNNILANC